LIQPFSGLAQNKPNSTDATAGVVLSADASPAVSGSDRNPRAGKKYNRSAMENRRHLQCKALQNREKAADARAMGSNERTMRRAMEAMTKIGATAYVRP
jgi:hypothetical protein